MTDQPKPAPADPTVPDVAPIIGDAKPATRKRRGSPRYWFLYGTSTGVLIATAIAVVMFLMIRGKLERQYDSLRAELLQARTALATRTDQATRWHAAYERVTADGVSVELSRQRAARFEAFWRQTLNEVDRQLAIVAWRPQTGDSDEYVAAWKQKYVLTRAEWWNEIETAFGATPEGDGPPPVNDDKALQFYRLAIWSHLCDDDRDTRDALVHALKFSPNNAHIRARLGYRFYRVRPDVAAAASAETLTKLRAFENRWVGTSDQEKIRELEATTGVAPE